jgi:hypothetical protein
VDAARPQIAALIIGAIAALNPATRSARPYPIKNKRTQLDAVKRAGT